MKVWYEIEQSVRDGDWNRASLTKYESLDDITSEIRSLKLKGREFRIVKVTETREVVE